MTNSTRHFPFSAVLGQSDFKLALLLVAVNPLIGGVLISGPRGSAKSTLSKGLAELLPETGHQAHPFVTLPLGATEEMLIGTLNLQQVLNEQQVTVQPGLLAKAHGGVLYVDEVNLLPDNLVDQLLDVAASGVNHIERDGISHQHDARFVLLGTMNPDEGDLRPQLTDRFGLSVQINNQFSLQERVEIVQRREAFDDDRAAFIQQHQASQAELKQQIANAQALLPNVTCASEHRLTIAQRSQDANVDGLRADIVWLQAARAHAALAQRNAVIEEDIIAVEEFVLAHRRQQTQPPQPPRSTQPEPPPFKRPEHSKKDNATGEWGAMEPVKQKTELLKALEQAEAESKSTQPTTFDRLQTTNRYSGTDVGKRRGQRFSEQLDWFRTLATNAGQWPLKQLAFKQRREGRQVVNLILLDTSGSVLANKGFGLAKGAILQIAQRAYLQREQIAIVGFGNDQVDTLLPVRRAPKQIQQWLDELTAGGGTPFHQGLTLLHEQQSHWLRKHPDAILKTCIITDGRIQIKEQLSALAGIVTVVDIEQAPVKRGQAQRIAKILNARYVPLFTQDLALVR